MYFILRRFGLWSYHAACDGSNFSVVLYTRATVEECCLGKSRLDYELLTTLGTKLS